MDQSVIGNYLYPLTCGKFKNRIKGRALDRGDDYDTASGIDHIGDLVYLSLDAVIRILKIYLQTGFFDLLQ